jgi:hypothetical protein
MSSSPPLELPEGDGSRSPSRDRLTILRVLLLTAGVAAGLSVFAPEKEADSFEKSEWWLMLANAFVIGLSLPAPLFTLRFRRVERPQVGFGALFALMASLGVILLLPPALVERLHSDKGEVHFCLYYVLPLLGLWFVLAILLTGGFRRIWRKAESPWTERYGFFLALLWSPLGIWHTVHFYIEAFD